MPIHHDIDAALQYYKVTASGLGPPTIIDAQTVQTAADTLEERMRASWREYGSAHLFCGRITVHMFVVLPPAHLYTAFADKLH